MTGSESTGGQTFRKSSFSTGGNCVAIGRTPDGAIGVRRSTPDNSPVIEFSDAEWAAFVKGVKNGEFDNP